MLNYAMIGEKIRYFRKKRALSQEQLAEKVWISVTHMSHIETGQTKLSLPVLVDLATALNVTPNDLLADQIISASTDVSELEAMLNTCTPSQAAALTNILLAAKAALDQYSK